MGDKCPAVLASRVRFQSRSAAINSTLLEESSLSRGVRRSERKTRTSTVLWPSLELGFVVIIVHESLTWCGAFPLWRAAGPRAPCATSGDNSTHPRLRSGGQ